MEIDIQTIRSIAQKDKIAFKKHSILRMSERDISADDVRAALIDGEIIEAYSDIRPLPCCLVLGFRAKDSPLHVVTAIDAEEQVLWVITVYRPSVEEWDAAYRKRINS